MTTPRTPGQIYYEATHAELPPKWAGPPWDELDDGQKAQAEGIAVWLRRHYPLPTEVGQGTPKDGEMNDDPESPSFHVYDDLWRRHARAMRAGDDDMCSKTLKAVELIGELYPQAAALWDLKYGQKA